LLSQLLTPYPLRPELRTTDMKERIFTDETVTSNDWLDMYVE
jgi:hypothetical protein